MINSNGYLGQRGKFSNIKNMIDKNDNQDKYINNIYRIEL